MIVRYNEVLGGLSRISFQMNASSLPHAKRMMAIEAIGNTRRACGSGKVGEPLDYLTRKVVLSTGT